MLHPLSLWLLAMVTTAGAQVAPAPFEYQSPRPAAESVSRHSSIILRPGPRLEPASISASLVVATGSRSGPHGGQLKLAGDARTLVFTPDLPFAPGERITLSLSGGLRAATGGAIAPRSFDFTVDATPDDVLAAVAWPSELARADASARPAFESPALESPALKSLALESRALESPALESPASQSSPHAEPNASSLDDFPELTVTTNDAPAPGRVYLANFAFSDKVTTTPYLMVLDDEGVPLFRRRLGLPAFDFKRQRDGSVTYYDSELGTFVVLDSNYQMVRTVAIGSGYQTDVHELIILANGNALLMGLAPRRRDLSGVVPGGRTDAIVLDMVIQEIEPDGTVVFEWRSADHFAVTDAIFEDLTAETVDHVHPNSLDVDLDGNILLSSRHLDEVTKISRTTGEIIWRLGGRHNQFTFTNDSGRFSYQHDARRLANGNLLLYDNGNHHATPASRAVEYDLDEVAMTATRVWEFRHTPEIFAYAMGSAQRLANGNTLIAWGSNNTVTEVRRDGSVAWEMTMPPGVFTYRAFRMPAASARVTAELASPPNDSTGIDLSVALRWHRAGGAAGYDLQVATDSAFGDIVEQRSSISTTDATIDGLREWTQYFWRVRPVGAEIDGAWSDVWTFTTTGVALVQQLIAPPQSARLAVAPALQWEAFPGALASEVQLSRNDIFFTTPTIDTTIGGSVLWLESIDADDRWYWRVRPIGATGPGNWSQVRDFRTERAIVAPAESITPLAPASDAVVGPGSILFRWSAANASAMRRYRLQVSTNPSIVSGSSDRGIVLDTTVAAAEHLASEGFVPGTRYWWRLRATNELGEQFSSPVGTFTVDAAMAVDDEIAVGLASRGSIGSSALAPNPAGDRALLRVTLLQPCSVRVRLLDARGASVGTLYSGAAAAGPLAVGLDLENLAEGVYLCVVSTPDATRTHRLVVVR